MKGPYHIGLNLPAPQGILILVIDQDKVTFKKDSRMENFIVLSFNPFLMSLIDYGDISTLLIEMFQMKEALFETRSLWKELNS